MEIRDVFFFDKMLTPTVIAVVYWLALIGVVVGGIVVMISQSFFGGLLTIVFGALFARIWCELVIVLFKVNDALQEIRRK
jgi:hypothetical protein